MGRVRRDSVRVGDHCGLLAGLLSEVKDVKVIVKEEN